MLGFSNAAEATKIANLLDAFETVPEPRQQDYLDAAHIYRFCRKKGFTIHSSIDCVIAQLCLRDNLPLLSKDRDFKHISRCYSLTLVEC